MSRSRTIANICGCFQRRPRWYRFFVIRWKMRLPLPVNARRTIGWPVCGSKSAVVPDDFRSRTGHLRDALLLVRVRRVGLEEVVDGLADLGVAGRARVRLGRRAGDHDRPGRDGEHLSALRHLLDPAREEPVTRVGRAGEDPLVLPEEVEGGRRALLRLRLLAGEQVEQARVGNRVAREALTSSPRGRSGRPGGRRTPAGRSSRSAPPPSTGSCTPASSMTIWSFPCFRISGSATPSLSMRWRMIETALSRPCWVTFWPFGGTACSTTSRPPCRSRPSRVFLWIGDPGTASSATPTMAARMMPTRIR